MYNITLLVKWFSFRWSCVDQVVGLDDPYESFPIWDILWLFKERSPSPEPACVTACAGLLSDASDQAFPSWGKSPLSRVCRLWLLLCVFSIHAVKSFIISDLHAHCVAAPGIRWDSGLLVQALGGSPSASMKQL